MPDKSPDDSPMDRRKFFRKGFAELIRPLASAIAPVQRVVDQIGKLDSITDSKRSASKIKPPAASNRTPLNIWLRPPGAIAEKDFIHTCTRGGECVRACPAECIKIDPTAASGEGAPYIAADLSACVVCDGLYCMHVCPSGSLVPTSINDIDMGTAVWQEETCIRAAGRDCQACVDQCPLGEVAITLNDTRIEVNPHGCIGCGMCQHYCPTLPKSIVVIAKAAKERE
jgi:MauM/NapG family ferredoxin protein